MEKKKKKENQEILFSLMNYALSKIQEDYSETYEEELKKNLRSFISNFGKRYDSCHRTADTFYKKYSSWVENSFLLHPVSPLPVPIPNKGSPPKKDFSDLTPRSKRRRVSSLTNSISCDEISYAAMSSLRKNDNIAAAQVLKEATTTPEKASEILKSFKNQKEEPEIFTPNEALSLCVEAKLSKAQYNLIRERLLSKKVNILPSYTKLLEAKKECYPEPKEVKISESEAEVTVKGLVEHSVKRILTLQKPVLETLSEEEKTNMTLIIL